MPDLEQQLRQYVADVLLEDEEIEIDLDTPLIEDRLIDSLNAEELIVHVHERFGVTIDDAPPSNWGTIRLLAELIRARQQESGRTAAGV